MGGLDKHIIEEIINVIRAHKEPEKIVLYGSRADGGHKAVSDIDIAIFAKNWDDSDIACVHTALEDKVNTLLKFDLVDFYRIEKQSLKNSILLKGQVIYESGKN